MHLCYMRIHMKHVVTASITDDYNLYVTVYVTLDYTHGDAP